MRARTARTFAFLDELVESSSAGVAHRELLALHLAEGREHAQDVPEAPWIQLPLLAHAAAGGDEEDAVPVAACCTLVYLGADLLDNLMDDELPGRWRERGPSQAMLAAATMLSALTRRALARVDLRRVPSARVARAERMLTEALLAMSAGQLADVSADRPVSLDAARAVAERKAGAEFAFCAEVGAATATDDEDVISHYSEFGFNLGAAGQIASDLGDLLRPAGSHDLSTGRRTLPIVHSLLRQAPGERDGLEILLGDAQRSPEAHAAVRKALVAAGSILYTGLVVGVYLARARRALDAARPPADHRPALEAIVSRMESKGLA